jgi:hypothetical protein
MFYIKSGRDNVVGIATYYTLDGSGFEPRWAKETFSSPNLCTTALWHIHPPVQWVPGLFLRGKVAGA